MTAVCPLASAAPRVTTLTVIVCTWNRAASLSATLDALCAQRVDPEVCWDVLVVDNNSTDNTREVVSRYRDIGGVAVRYTFEAKQGLSHARNHGIREATAELIAFTDDDVLPEPDWVSQVAAAFARHRADGVGGRILPRWAHPPPDWLIQDPECLGNLALRQSDALTELRADSPASATLYGANMAFRRSVLLELGGFAVDLGRRGNKLYSDEETDLLRRAIAAGKHIVYDPAIAVWHCIARERMHKRYFFKWRFRRAEAAACQTSEVAPHSLIGVPLWRVRLIASGTAGVARAWCTRGDELFEAQLRVTEHLGFAWGCLKRHWRGSR